MTQTDRVLAALTRAGARGLTRVDFQLPDVIDGGPPILNIPARIEELRSQGFNVVSGERRLRCTVYRLQQEGQLFELPTRNAIFGDTA